MANNETKMSDSKEPSKERGCEGKINFGWDYIERSNHLSKKHGKRYGAYKCPHCLGIHLTTKIDKAGEYKLPLLYVT